MKDYLRVQEIKVKTDNKTIHFCLRNCFRSYFIILSAVIFVLFSISLSFAGNVTFIKEYTYQASELDSKASCRTISLELVKRLLLEELGTYLISETEVKDFKLTKEQVKTYSAGIVGAEIIEDKWDGKTYWLKAKVSADPKEVSKSLKKIMDDQFKGKELEDVKKKADEAFKEIERLKKELEAVKADKNKQKEYARAVDILSAIDWFIKGYLHDLKNEYDSAIEAYTSAIILNPNYAAAYYLRGLVYDKKGQYDRMIEDFNMGIVLAPNYDAYRIRGLAYDDKSKYDKVIDDFNKAIALNPNNADDYYIRGNAYAKKGQYDRAIEDYNKAITLNPDYANAYKNRGLTYGKKGQYDKAIENYNKAIALDLNDAKSYYTRGLVYVIKGDVDKAISDFQKACDMGNENGCKGVKMVLEKR